MRKTVVLLILDGWGIGEENSSNPIYAAEPKNFLWIKEHYPTTTLQASGISVGLPWSEIGNSEVGHLTLGAGKVLYQYFPRITLAIHDGSFFKNPALTGAFDHAKKNNSLVHLVGLLSKTNIHSSVEHLEALLRLGEQKGVTVYVHLFADGKDSPARSMEELLRRVPEDQVASIIGRYYAMDREKKWRLTKEAYDTLLGKSEISTGTIKEALAATYARGLTEEFLPGLRVNPKAGIRGNDVVIFFNFREDGMRQLAEAFCIQEFKHFPVERFVNLYVATMTQYENDLKVPVAFPPQVIKYPLGKIIEHEGKNQLRLAETYKYAHVTYFFNGYREAPFKNEYRVLIPSIATPHADEHPEMMASAVTDRLLPTLENQAFDFILVNYANPDVVAHTGNYDAAIKAVKAVDAELGRILGVRTPEITLVVTADHGNVEAILDLFTGRAAGHHNPNPVPLCIIGERFQNRKFVNGNIWTEPLGVLSDVAPTILDLMDIPKPKEMDGHSLLEHLR